MGGIWLVTIGGWQLVGGNWLVAESQVEKKRKTRSGHLISRLASLPKSYKFNSVPQESPTRVFRKNVPQECPTRVSYKSVPQECPTREFRKSVPPESSTRVSDKGAPQECPTRVSDNTVL